MTLLKPQIQKTVDEMVQKHFSDLGGFPENIRLRNCNGGGKSSKILLSDLTMQVNNYLQKQGLVGRGARVTRDVLGYALIFAGYTQVGLYSFKYEPRKD